MFFYPNVYKQFLEYSKVKKLTATVLSPPTIPAVYHAARIKRGPPRKHIGASMAPITPVCSNQANCLGPIPSLYSILWHNIPVPIIAAKLIAKPYKRF